MATPRCPPKHATPKQLVHGFEQYGKDAACVGAKHRSQRSDRSTVAAARATRSQSAPWGWPAQDVHVIYCWPC